MAKFMLFSTLLALFACLATAQDWQNGRATWFDVENGDLKTANCHMSWDQIRTGYDVGAISDLNPLFSSSCGICLEVRCQPASFSDGYGASIDRSSSGICYGGQSVFVTIADACPCNYPNNAGSNKRWCCNDDPSRQHVDITRGAFSKLADLKWGVIGIQWRVVDCAQVNPNGNSYSLPASQPTASSGSNGNSNSNSNSNSNRNSNNNRGGVFGWWLRG